MNVTFFQFPRHISRGYSKEVVIPVSSANASVSVCIFRCISGGVYWIFHAVVGLSEPWSFDTRRTHCKIHRKDMNAGEFWALEEIHMHTWGCTFMWWRYVSALILKSSFPLLGIGGVSERSGIFKMKRKCTSCSCTLSSFRGSAFRLNNKGILDFSYALSLTVFPRRHRRAIQTQ